MSVGDDIARIAELVVASAAGAALTGILAAEPQPGERRYLCAFGSPDGSRSWLVVGDDGEPVVREDSIRETVALAALCEIAADHAFPGDLDELRAQLVQLRITEAPPGVDEADSAALALQHALGSPPQLATAARLDEIGAAVRRLEVALDATVPSPFSAAMLAGQAAVEELVEEVRTRYRMKPLSSAASHNVRPEK